MAKNKSFIKKYLIIDGTNLLFRCYYSSCKKNEEGAGRSAVYFFLNVLRSYIRQFDANEIIVAWDDRLEDVDNDRKLISKDYKANREYNADIFTHVNLLKTALDSLGVRQMHPLKREADDIMYWLCAYRLPNQCTLVTTDTDMYQLLLPELKDNILYNPTRKIQVTPVYLKMNYNTEDGREFILQKCLKGDKSDNIQGIRGLRYKTKNAKSGRIISLVKDKLDFELLRQSGLLNEEEVKIFETNCKLMMLEGIKDIKEETDYYEKQMQTPLVVNKSLFRDTLKELEFWNIIRSIDQWVSCFTSLMTREQLEQNTNDSVATMYKLPLD